jgi:hypothetical protein
VPTPLTPATEELAPPSIAGIFCHAFLRHGAKC